MAKTKGDFKLTTEPDDKLTFVGPFDKETTAEIKLTNTDDKRRAFKVKCTNNDLFRIRPAVGKVDGKGTVTVSITCKPIKDDKDLKTNHHFNVYHVQMDGDDPPRKVWADKKDAEGTKTMPVEFSKGDAKDGDGEAKKEGADGEEGAKKSEAGGDKEEKKEGGVSEKKDEEKKADGDDKDSKEKKDDAGGEAEE